MTCHQPHDGWFVYDPAQHSDACLAQTMGLVYREMQKQLIPFGDPRVWMLPCPRCAKGYPGQQLILDIRVGRYRCAVCKLDLPAKEIEDAAGGIKLEVV